MPNKRIGFVDYRLDNFHADVYLSALRGPLLSRGYEIVGATALEHEPSEKWACEHDVPYFTNVNELAKSADYFAVLAPANPELHLQLCQAVFPLGRPTFVDKTFAPDLQTAKEIFKLADTNGVAVQSTSALRTSSVQEALSEADSPLQAMFITSAGPTFDEYGIHPVELAVSCLGPEVETYQRHGTNEHPRFVLQFSGQRMAVIDFNQTADVPFSATLVTDDGYQHVVVDMDSLFTGAAASILDFFDCGQPMIDRDETLSVRHILDLANRADLHGQIVEVAASSIHYE